MALCLNCLTKGLVMDAIVSMKVSGLDGECNGAVLDLAVKEQTPCRVLLGRLSPEDFAAVHLGDLYEVTITRVGR